ncbi:MAG TPA: glycogen synthase GlgA [Novosphingobium sp.]
MTMRVLSVASEAVPLVKTGGLADVAGALPAAVEPHGIAITTLLPGYPAVLQAAGKLRTLHNYSSLLGEPARLLVAKLGQHPLILLDAPNFFGRGGGPYADESGRDWGDNWRRFAALGRAAADLAGGAVKGKRFDVLHAHDWQAAMAPAYLRFAPVEGGRKTPSVITIHNMAFQGCFGPEIFPGLELPREAFSIHGVEYHRGVSFLKAGMETASAITTVSPTYAAEIRDPLFGMGLEGLVLSRSDRVQGILNGIDETEWNPETDHNLTARYTRATLGRRTENKRALESEFALEPDNGPLFIVISRLTWQKGMDVLLEALDHLVGIGGRLALLGSGDAAMEAGFHAAAARHPSRIAVRTGYDETLAHRMQGGGDAILIPSRFEPCGLTQLYGLAYGCIPVVARTGGLADTVIDANVAAMQAGTATGVQFDGVTYHALSAAISRTVALYRQDETWRQVQRNGMKCDFSWKRNGKAYAELYTHIVTENR